jgi:hypothetical protein
MPMRAAVGDVGEERVVEDGGDRPRALRQEEDQQGVADVSRPGEEEQHRDQRTGVCEEPEETELGGGEVADRAKGRGEQEHEQGSEPHGVSEQRLTVEPLPEDDHAFVWDDLPGEEAGQQHRQGGGRVGRVGPVIHGPAEDRPAIVLHEHGAAR